jgi:hypothetical protein
MAPKKVMATSPPATRARRAAATKAVEKIHNINKPQASNRPIAKKTTIKRVTQQTTTNPVAKSTKKTAKDTPKKITKAPSKSRGKKTIKAANITKAVEASIETVAPILMHTTRSGRLINAPKTFAPAIVPAASTRGTKRTREPHDEPEPPMKRSRLVKAAPPQPKKASVRPATKRALSDVDGVKRAPPKRRRVAEPVMTKEVTLAKTNPVKTATKKGTQVAAQPKTPTQSPTLLELSKTKPMIAPVEAAPPLAVTTPPPSSSPLPVAESTPQHPTSTTEPPIPKSQTVAARSMTALPASPTPPPAGQSTPPPAETSTLLEESIDLMKGPISFVDFSEDVYDIARYHPIPRPSISVAGNDSTNHSILSAPRTPFSPRRRRRHGSAEVRKHFENPDPPTGRKFLVRGYDPKLDTPPVQAASAPVSKGEPTPPPIVTFFSPAPTFAEESEIQPRQKGLHTEENKENGEEGDRSVGCTYGMPDDSIVSAASVGRTYGVPDYSITDTSFFSATSTNSGTAASKSKPSIGTIKGSRIV